MVDAGPDAFKREDPQDDHYWEELARLDAGRGTRGPCGPVTRDYFDIRARRHALRRRHWAGNFH